MIGRIKWYPIIIGMFLLADLSPVRAQNQDPLPFVQESFEQNFELDFKATVLGTLNGVATSNHNPGNSLARLQDTQILLTLKPDMFFTTDQWLISIKPRLSFQIDQYDIEGISHSGTDENIEIIEFKVRKSLSQNLFVSYGWENIQWGPSFLYSPSNPFYRDNGKKDIVNELAGKGVAKLLYIHDFYWSVSLILNTDHGAFNESDFEKTYAMKVDYSGDESYASFILSHTEHQRTKLGLYGGTTLSDAILVYGEASIEQGSPVLFARTLPGAQKWEMDAIKDEDHSFYPVFLAGLSYTLESADTLTIEYLYYGHGYDDHQMQQFNQLVDDAAGLYASSSGLSGYGTKLLGQAADNKLDFLRQHYIMGQYLNEDIIDDLDLVSRVTVCLEDMSTRLYSSLSYDLNDYVELKTSGMVNTGGTGSSFGRFLDYQIQVALEIVF